VESIEYFEGVFVNLITGKAVSRTGKNRRSVRCSDCGGRGDSHGTPVVFAAL